MHAPAIEVIRDYDTSLWGLMHPRRTDPRFAAELGLRTIFLAKGHKLNVEGRVDDAKYGTHASERLDYIYEHAKLHKHPTTRLNSARFLQDMVRLSKNNSGLVVVHVLCGFVEDSARPLREFGWLDPMKLPLEHPVHNID